MPARVCHSLLTPLVALAMGLCLGGIVPAARAQSWPTKPIRLVIGNPAGSSADIVTRTLADALQGPLGQPIIVDNKPGGGTGGTIGMQAVFSAEPDGYTLGVGTSGPLGAGPALVKLSWDPPKDFTAVAQISEGTNFLGVAASLGVSTLPELIAKAKANPGKYSYGSDGVGSTTHLGFELFKIRAGNLDIVHIPYKGASEKYPALLAGDIQFFLNSPTKVIDEMIRDGKLKVVAVTAPERLADYPAVPTMAEAGLSGIDVRSWFGVVGPKGLPPAIVERLNREIVATLARPDVIARMKAAGQNARASSPQDFAKLMGDANRQWKEVVEKANIKVDN